MLDEWCTLGAPMLLYVDAAGVASLTGPVATLTGLEAPRRARRRSHVTNHGRSKVKRGRSQTKKPAVEKPRATKVKPPRQAKMAHRPKSQ